MLRSSIRSGKALCLREVLLFLSHKLIINKLALVGFDENELLSLVRISMEKMIDYYRLSLQRTVPLPFDIIRFITSWMFNLMLAEIYNFKI